MMRVLYLDHSSDFSGGQRSLISLLSQVESNYHLLVDKGNEKMQSALNRLNLDYQAINYGNYKGVLEYVFLPITILKILILCRRIKCDIIHANTFKSGVIGGIVALILRKPMIFRARLGIDVNGHGIIDKIIYRLSTVVLANSYYVKDTFIRTLGVNGDKIRVIYNPINLENKLNKSKDEILAKYDLDKRNDVLIGVIGRIEEIKRVKELVSAIELLKDTTSGFKVLLIGDESKLDGGKYSKEVKQEIQSKDLQNYFSFTGFVEDIENVISVLDITVLCTIGEALPRSIFESQFYSKSVIATNSGGNVELIEDGKTGLLYTPGRHDELSEKLKSLITNNELRAKLGTSGKVFVDHMFSIENTLAKEIELYKEVGFER